MKYRSKLIEVEAYCYQAELGNNRLMNWLAQHHANINDWIFFDGEITIPGYPKVVDGDFIIKDTNDDFISCKPNEFLEIFEPVINLCH